MAMAPILRGLFRIAGSFACQRLLNDSFSMPPIPLLLSAGEASGDMYAAQLATALQSRLDVQIFGMGGPQMQAAGVEIVTNYEEVAVVGITEILKHLPSLVKAMDRIVAKPRSASRRWRS